MYRACCDAGITFDTADQHTKGRSRDPGRLIRAERESLVIATALQPHGGRQRAAGRAATPGGA
jgi:hypothetical protein